MFAVFSNFRLLYCCNSGASSLSVLAVFCSNISWDFQTSIKPKLPVSNKPRIQNTKTPGHSLFLSFWSRPGPRDPTRPKDHHKSGSKGETPCVLGQGPMLGRASPLYRSLHSRNSCWRPVCRGRSPSFGLALSVAFGRTQRYTRGLLRLHHYPKPKNVQIPN